MFAMDIIVSRSIIRKTLTCRTHLRNWPTRYLKSDQNNMQIICRMHVWNVALFFFLHSFPTVYHNFLKYNWHCYLHMTKNRASNVWNVVRHHLETLVHDPYDRYRYHWISQIAYMIPFILNFVYLFFFFFLKFIDI